MPGARELIALSALLVAAFLFEAIPLLRYPRVGGDPFVHYEYSLALLKGKLSIPIETGNSGSSVDLYYPPLFHLISLGFFLALPTVDPFATMKILASAFAAFQLIPIYAIVKRISGSSVGALLASYALLATRSDYEMLAWGGYANIAGLFFAACLVYAVIADGPVLSGIFAAALALTHHLSTILMIAVLVPYFLILIWTRKGIPKSLVGVAIGAVIAYVSFYQFGLTSILNYYANFSPVYNQSLYVTPYILEQVGGLLLLSAALAVVLIYRHEGWRFIRGKKILVIWAVVPVLLAYAYLFGVQWHGVRWIAFIPEPLSALAGVGFAYLHQRKFLIIILVLFTLQLILTLMGYHSYVLRNISQ
jgi:hypothetical protein